MINMEQKSFVINKIIGLEKESEDREVGIFGNIFSLGFEDKDKNAMWLDMSDSEFIDLLELLRPHFESMEKSNDTEMLEYYKKKSKVTGGEYSPEFLAQEDGLKRRDLQ